MLDGNENLKTPKDVLMFAKELCNKVIEIRGIFYDLSSQMSFMSEWIFENF